jgi:hydrogenase maturation protein HypF
MATILHPVLARQRILVKGIVQGVGFRPFVHRLAQEKGIKGFVLNTSSGVTIEAEGDAQSIDNFLSSLRRNPPRLAQIEEITTTILEPLGDEHFEIKQSQAIESEFALISPDVSICEDCLQDLAEPANRRFAYPFTNCTNCGPRYTIVQDIPYDRPKTTMVGFQMCAACEAEYHDPASRRFHAQPNACAACGPTLSLTAKNDGSYETAEPGDSISLMRQVRRVLRDGQIVAVKGLGGFQLACDAENGTAVRALRQRKKRSDKPFSLMARDVADVEKICVVSSADKELLLRPQRPIVILPRRENTTISEDIAPGNKTIGVMLAYTPLHYLLFADKPDVESEFTALVMTSGNISDEPIVISNQEARERLAPVADWFLFHNRDIYMRVDDSVARTFEDRSQILRRSRGYAPQTINLGSPQQELLACGGELKNTFCLTKGSYAILSQHIGDVENYETLEFFYETLTNLKKLFRVEPQAVAHDLHPLYMTSRVAAELPLRKIGVQHHHAHIASCMAENGLHGKVIGVAFDGTGYGTDRQIWGGEFLIADFLGFERKAHFRYVPLPGGNVAVHQPWRPALSWLMAAFGEELPGDIPLFREIRERDIATVAQMIRQHLNTVLTSSCGRLFDAVASLIGLRQQVTFEGQAAIELEMVIQPGTEDRYSFDLEEHDPVQIDFRPTIREIVQDVRTGKAQGLIAARFHNTIAAVIADVCQRVRENEHLNRVCLSGGTFQNMYLLERSVNLLRNLDFEVYWHSKVPSNDGGISLGQAVIANEILHCGA